MRGFMIWTEVDVVCAPSSTGLSISEGILAATRRSRPTFLLKNHLLHDAIAASAAVNAARLELIVDEFKNF